MNNFSSWCLKWLVSFSTTFFALSIYFRTNNINKTFYFDYLQILADIFSNDVADLVFVFYRSISSTWNNNSSNERTYKNDLKTFVRYIPKVCSYNSA